MSIKEILEEKPNTVTRNPEKNASSIETEESSVRCVSDVHTHYGNHSVNEAFHDGMSGLDSLIRSSIGMEASGMSFGGSVQEWMGNQGVGAFIHRKKLQGGSEGEVLPDISDPSVQRIGKGTGEKLQSDLQRVLEEEFQPLHRRRGETAGARFDEPAKVLLLRCARQPAFQSDCVDDPAQAGPYIG